MALYNEIGRYGDAIQFAGTDADFTTNIEGNYQAATLARAQEAATKTVVTIEVTHKVTSNGNIVVLDGGLDGTVVSVAVLTTDSLEGIAAKIAAETYANMTCTAVGAVLTMTAAAVGNLAGMPEIYSYPAGFTYTATVGMNRGTYLDGSGKEILWGILSGTPATGTIKIYFNEAAATEVSVTTGDTLAQVITAIEAVVPTGYSINTGPSGSKWCILSNDAPGENAIPMTIDFGLTKITAGKWYNWDWEQGQEQLKTAVVSLENEISEVLNVYKTDWIIVTHKYPTTQSTEIWSASDFALFWTAQGG